MTSVAAYEQQFPHLGFGRPADGVLEVVLRAPGRRNAVHTDMHHDLTHVWGAINKDPDTLAVVLRGEDGVFSAGGDFEMIQGTIDDFAFRAHMLRETLDLVYNYINCYKPTVSAVEGPAVGAGLCLAILADISVVGRTATLIDGHTRLGVPAGDHAALIWPILCGLAKAKYYMLLCESITGEEAERIGLVSVCEDDDKVVERAHALAQRLTTMSQFSVQWTKYAMNNWLRQAGPTFDASLALELVGFSSPETREGLDALRERRAPQFNSPELRQAMAQTRTSPNGR